MDIMFEIVGRQKHSESLSVSHVFNETGGYIGRADDCEWVLSDRDRLVSRKHALITYENGDFYLEDASSNGVFLSPGHEAIGKRNRHKILHGQNFIIGEYTITAKLMQNPGSYVSGAASTAVDENLLSFSRPLSLDPLAAMDQEEELIARNRLGEFDDLLGKKGAPLVRQDDHSDPRLMSIPPVIAVPESKEMLPEDWDDDPDTVEPSPAGSLPKDYQAAHPVPPRVAAGLPPDVPTPSPAPPLPPSPPVPAPVAMPETEAFFRAVGFAEAPSSPEERERILRLAGEMLAVMTDGLSRALQNRAECQNELRLPRTITNIAVGNNPFKFSPTAEAALATLLGKPQKGVLPPIQALREAFKDLHSHHMGLLAGARAAVRAVLGKISPNAVETRLDINGQVRLLRTRRLWHTFIRMHHALHDDDEGFAGLFLQDFARAYEVQGRTLNPPSPRSFTGEKP